MQNRHLITKQVFELRVGADESHITQLQDSFSKQFWQAIYPAFERLFDRLVAGDRCVQVPRLELDLGYWSADDIFAGRFVESLTSQLETAISSALQGIGAELSVQAVHDSRFDLWLHFLECGFFPVSATRPESQKQWHREVFEYLDVDGVAKKRFRDLISRSSIARERLILQHDKAFLLQLLEHLSKQTQVQLSRLIEELIRELALGLSDLSNRILSVSGNASAALEGIADALLDLLINMLDEPLAPHRQLALRKSILHSLDSKALDPSSLVDWLIQADCWESILSGVLQTEHRYRVSQRMSVALRKHFGLHRLVVRSSLKPGLMTHEQQRQAELTVWRILIDEVIVKNRQSNTLTLMARVIQSDELAPWRSRLFSQLFAIRDDNTSPADAAWSQVKEIVESFVPQREQEGPVGEDKLIEPDKAQPFSHNTSNSQQANVVEVGDAFYVQAAGVILLHPFLPAFFKNLGLYEEGAFVDEISQQRAVCLVQHLATGDVRTPEYQLILPKFICGMHLNAPLDHFIEMGEPEQAESENLIRAAVDHWGALGHCSAGWLREMFLQRDGKLVKKETGWCLVVERKTQDVLLDRLPQGWGLGIVKLPWMDELLQIEW